MKVRIKKLVSEAVIPTYAHPFDAGLDLTATSKTTDDFGNTVYGTGISIEIPQGYVGLVFPRSSNAKKSLWLTNHVGVIDSGYRGEIKFKFRSSCVVPTLWSRIKDLLRLQGGRRANIYHGNEYEVGERIGQLIIVKIPQIELVESNKLSSSDRGTGGYGSTGK